MTSYTKEVIELALERGLLFAAMGQGRQWRVRRNGKTQTWKTRPGEFRIPLKAGLNKYGEITHSNMNDGTFEIKG